MDTCGFPKDAYFYLKAWWTDEPVLHLFPHWNWPGREGQLIPVLPFAGFLHHQLQAFARTMPMNIFLRS